MYPFVSLAGYFKLQNCDTSGTVIRDQSILSPVCTSLVNATFLDSADLFVLINQILAHIRTRQYTLE